MSPELPIALLAGVVLGVSAHRAGLCTVKAVSELFTTRKAQFFWSFLKASLWTAGILVLAGILGLETELAQRPVQPLALLGGLLFGLGAGLNGACSFSTLSRLADGHLVMLCTLAGWGIAMPVLLNARPDLHLAAQSAVIPQAMAIPLSLWMLWEMRGIWLRRKGILDGFKNGFWTLSAAVLLIAVANAALLLSGRSWSFTSTALCSSGELPLASCQHPGMLWMISATAMTAMLVSAIWRRSFRLRRPRWPAALRHFMAGLIMGSGAALIPGGNDGLILFGLPGLSPHALPTWIAIIFGIALSLLAMRLAGWRIPKISCDGDVCRTSM